MSYIIDTNILVFLLSGDDDNLSNDVQNILFDYSNTLYVSSLSLIEIIFLFKNNKIKTKYKSSEELLQSIENEYYLQVLQTKPEHFKIYSQLKIAENHKDQIDHFIISQAICEKMPLVSSDRKFRDYRTQNLDFVYNRR